MRRSGTKHARRRPVNSFESTTHPGLTIVTRDGSDHQKSRAPVLDPWLDPPLAGTP
jgi:hypothetical protein